MPTIPSQHTFRIAAAVVAVVPLLLLFVLLLFHSAISPNMAHHSFDLSTHTYFDVKIQLEAIDHILASTRTAAASENGSLSGVEYIGHVGELKNHLLYRVSKQQQEPSSHTTTNTQSTPSLSSGQQGSDWEEQRNQQIVDAISAVQGVVHVDIQIPRQRNKKDEL